jgi:hypothetical protein
VTETDRPSAWACFFRVCLGNIWAASASFQGPSRSPAHEKFELVEARCTRSNGVSSTIRRVARSTTRARPEPKLRPAPRTTGPASSSRPTSARRLRKKKAAAAAGERRGEERLREGATQATLYPTTTRREHAIQDASPPCLLQWGRVAHRVLRCHGRERRGDFARRPFESSNIRFAPHVSTTPFLHFATFSPFIVGGLG